mgnify:CR=1 FL=1
MALGDREDDGHHTTYHHADLFQWLDRQPSTCRVAIVHCVSACLANGAGFARGVTNRYGRPPEYQNEKVKLKTGDCVIQPIAGSNVTVVHVVTKPSLQRKPSKSWFALGLDNAAKQCASGDYDVVIAPLLGAGLDRLPIDYVVQKIGETIGNIDGMPVHVFVNQDAQWPTVATAVSAERDKNDKRRLDMSRHQG